MPDKTAELKLLMVEADRWEPSMRRGVPVRKEGEPERPRRRRGPVMLGGSGDDPNSLEAQGWTVIAPDGARGDRLLELLDPLIRRRDEQQGKSYEPLRVPAGPMTGKQAVDWVKSTYAPGSRTEEEIPFYTLLLGDLHEVSLELQQALGVNYHVGRLAFDHDDDYRRYAHKVIAWEDRTPTDAHGRALLYTVDDNTEATLIGDDVLMGPGHAKLEASIQRGRLRGSRVESLHHAAGADPAGLLDVAGAETPTVLLSMSHGLGRPKDDWLSDDDRRARQGAMYLGRKVSMPGSEVVDRRFLPGGIWFMVACHGAGIPGRSAYHHWLAKLRDVGEADEIDGVLRNLPTGDQQPFVAALPKAVLASEQGPLAFVGHMDLAWSYSFLELDSGEESDQPGRFVSTVDSLLRRKRVGPALKAMSKHLAMANAQLTTALDDAQAGVGTTGDAAMGHLWMQRQDLAAYVLLGDPAAHLPLEDPAHRARPRRDPVPAVAPSPGGTSAAPAELPASLPDLEEAFGYLLAEERSLKQEARRLGIDRADLDALFTRYRDAGRRALGGG